ncbi:MAG TPA: TAT-variant-translocated molybdopterin oxidoreductase [Candidatus Krumholzibacteria bacterium]|nr:TAT-variant-translocated molybdopterin oxidoreductase [Candidatus Krumholzibacteria bacterium]HRX51890.1 TAT-variant-translocated molybdopterin oxidoreductase [Candidatus Krumholzibacteria bacterium]
MSSLNKSPDQAYWRSLEDLGDTPEFRQFLDAEFPAEAEVPTDALSRRRFLQLMGASVAMAGAAGCRWPEEKIVPFASRPEGTDPGVPRTYATNWELGGDVRSLLVTSYEGRPIKVEGNPDHPLSLGATDSYSQALVLGLYDPDRSKRVRDRHKGDHAADWAAFDAWAAEHFAGLKARRGDRLAFLVERTSSPTTRRLKARVQELFPAAGWYEWEPISRDNARTGAALAFGKPVETGLDLSRAKVIACFDADILNDHPAALRQARQFAEGRRAEHGSMNRLYAVEADYSLTGGMADHRYAVPASLVGEHLLQLAAVLAGEHHVDLGVAGSLLHGSDHAPAWIRTLATDLAHHRGASVVAVGPRQPEWCHVLGHVINAGLGNVGATVTYTDVTDPERGATHGASIGLLADALHDNRLDTVVILGGNPVFDAPASLDFGAALAKAAHRVHLSVDDNETSKACTWHLPRAHVLESWADVRDVDGRYGVTQPLIRPLYDGRTPAELLAVIAGEPRSAHELVKATASSLVGGEDGWNTLLQKGLLADSEARAASVSLRAEGVAAAVRPAAAARRPELSDTNLEIQFVRDPALYDGRFANNAWLQELPDFMTKLTWDNAALFGVSTAGALGVKHGDVVSLAYDGRTLEMAAYILPGHASHSVTVSLGHGRTAAGQVGEGTGFPTYALRSAKALDFSDGLTVSKTGRTYLLACTQDHFAIDQKGKEEREKRSHTLIIEGTAQEYHEHPDFVEHRRHIPPLVSLWEERGYDGYAWGMTVDLNSCTGCNACVVACQAENNIPVVGKDQVSRGREMHWIRLDRYFQGEPDEAKVAQQPVACVHCEMAPCEQVCPVGATMHSEEGLNVMAYNRCVGTRYCANNCPYKVRRFNFYNYNKDIPETQRMVYNPEVTIRARGVMEKCTYCVQRIEHAKIQAKNENRPVRDGEITTACQQTCPTQAIVFGDLNDPNSRVAKETANQRSYHLLAELNVKPRTSYQARLRNPNPDLAESSDGHDGHH